ncbi:MAG TPA: hypothetical protein DEQ68_08185 [Ruminococcaceae bacterium]|nr:hypothetical protein [Oscillospiraceae bacterium]
MLNIMRFPPIFFGGKQIFSVSQNSQISAICRDKAKCEKALFCSKLQHFSRKIGKLDFLGNAARTWIFVQNEQGASVI